MLSDRFHTESFSCAMIYQFIIELKYLSGNTITQYPAQWRSTLNTINNKADQPIIFFFFFFRDVYIILNYILIIYLYDIKPNQ